MPLGFPERVRGVARKESTMWANSLSAAQIQFVEINLLSNDPDNWVGYRSEGKTATLKVGRYWSKEAGENRWHMEIDLGKTYPHLVEWDSANRCMNGFDILDRRAKDWLLNELLSEVMGVNQMSRASKTRLLNMLNGLLR